MVTFNTTDLVDAIVRNSHTPVGNSTFTTADFLAISDMEMRTLVAPKITSVRENYWLTTKEIPIDTDLNAYAIPSKSLGNSFVEVKIKTGGELFYQLSRIEVGEILSDNYSSRPSYSFYLEDNKIRLVPANVPGSVYIWYYRIPSKLVAVADCAQIATIADNVITTTSIPSSWTSSSELDITSQEPGFNVLLKDTTPASIVSTTITFTDSLPASVRVGDYVCLSGQSCVVQAPLEWVEVLVQAATVKVYEIQGYGQKHALAKKMLDEMVERTLGIISPRTIEQSKIIPGGGSLIFSSRRGWNLPVSRG